MRGSRSDASVVPRALTIAGSDSGGGAGIQADLNTFGAFGVFGTTAITALTVQNTTGVSGYEAASPELVESQIRAVVTDIGVDAAKTGMLVNTAIVEAVADTLAELGVPNLVVDPVSVSKHGHALLQPDAVDTLRARILPLATIVTPNLPEAAVLSGMEVHTPDDMAIAADTIRGLGARAVLVKGGHLEGAARADDLLVDAAGARWLRGDRIETPNTHGTGCTLSAAIAAGLARGESLSNAAESAKAFVADAIRHALAIGGGIGPVDPLWRSRRVRPGSNGPDGA